MRARRVGTDAGSGVELPSDDGMLLDVWGSHSGPVTRQGSLKKEG
jgi:hypothetical protein